MGKRLSELMNHDAPPPGTKLVVVHRDYPPPEEASVHFSPCLNFFEGWNEKSPANFPSWQGVRISNRFVTVLQRRTPALFKIDQFAKDIVTHARHARLASIELVQWPKKGDFLRKVG